MACLRAGVKLLPEYHAGVCCESARVESGLARQTCAGVSSVSYGKGCGGAGRMRSRTSVESGKVFFKGSGEFRRRVVVPVVGRTERKEVRSTSVEMDDKKVSTGSGGAVLEDVPHLTDWLPDLLVRVLV